MIYINGPFLSPVTHLVLAFYLLLKILLFIIEETIKLFFFSSTDISTIALGLYKGELIKDTDS